MRVAVVLFAIFAVVLAEAPAEQSKESSEAAAPKEKRGILGSYGYGYPYLGGYHGLDYGYHGLSYPYYGGYGGYSGYSGYSGYHAPIYSKSYYHAPIVSKSVVLPSYHVPYKYSSYHAPYYPYLH